MGLPELHITLEKSVKTIADRVLSGNLAMILKDTKANGIHTVRREADIPAGIGVANADAIRRALVGYITQPAVVYVSILPAEGNLADGFKALLPYDYDYLIGPPDLSSHDAQALADLVKGQREKNYIGKAVLPDTAADHEGIINFTATGIKDGKATYTAAQYCSRIAGVLAGTPAEASATYAGLPELTEVTAESDPDAAIDAGKLILIDDGRRIKLGRAVTSKVSLQEGEQPLLKKIHLVSTVDLIRHHCVTAVEDHYLGKVANSYDNKLLLLSELKDFLKALENRSVLGAGSSGAELDAAAARAWLVEQNRENLEELERIKALSDQELVREPTGSYVFIRLSGDVVDAMEDFHISLALFAAGLAA